MVCKIYNESLVPVGAVSSYISLVWSEQFCDIGSAQLVCTKNNKILELLKLGYFIGIDDSETLMRIHSIPDRKDQIWVYATEAKSELSNHILRGSYEFNGNIDKVIFDKLRGESLPKWLEFDENQLPYFVNSVQTFRDYNSITQTFCKENNCGYTFIFKNQKLYFSIYDGKHNESIILSDKLGNIANVERTTTDQNAKNFAIVKVNDDYWIEVDRTEGNERRELIVDASDLGQEDGSITAYHERLTTRGVEALEKTKKSDEYKFDVKENIFDRGLKLGDIVSANFSEYNITKKVRIEGFSITFENHTKKINLTIGENIKGDNQ